MGEETLNGLEGAHLLPETGVTIITANPPLHAARTTSLSTGASLDGGFGGGGHELCDFFGNARDHGGGLPHEAG